MELAFAEKALRDLCASRVRAERRFGAHVAAALRRWLSDLRAVDALDELLVARPYQWGEEGQLAVDVCEGVRLVFVSNHSAMRIDQPEGTAARVSRVKILRIEADHE